MVRQTALTFLTRAGTEIGVASTKAFTTQLVALFLLALTLAKLRNRLTAEDETRRMRSLRHLPAALQAALALEPQVIAWAEQFARKQNALFLGRGLHYPIALEGALKLKEISYIHAEAYAAGEMKHALAGRRSMPVVAIAQTTRLEPRSNLQAARPAARFTSSPTSTAIPASEGIHVIRLPEHAGLLSPVVHTIPLQLLAYHAAVIRGTDVDKPRNLAKSVTVE
jgi:glucosamine--fructose-6-phosphate aminotransferase (isomerizing)